MVWQQVQSLLRERWTHDVTRQRFPRARIVGADRGTHKATAARHLAKARDKLLRGTRARLKRELGVDSGELDSVMRLFDEEMSVSLSRLLK